MDLVLEKSEELLTKYSGMLGELSFLSEREKEVTKEVVDLKKQLRLLDDAVEFVKKCLEDSIHKKKFIEKVISDALTYSYGIEYFFRLVPVLDDNGVIKGLTPKVGRSLKQLRDLDRCGRGVLDIVTLSWNIVVLIISGQSPPLFVCDEPVSHISSEMQSRLKIYIETVCKEAGLQIIMITHQSAPFGKVYSVNISKGVSNVRNIPG